MQTTGWEFGKYLIAPVVSALLGYLIGAFTKVSKTEHKATYDALESRIEKQHEKLGERISRFEQELRDKVSKAELKEAVSDLKAIIMEMKVELREDFVQLRAALNARPQFSGEG